MSPNRLEKIKRVLNRRQTDLTVVMENIHKPQNMAAIARTCDAVGIPTIHLVSDNPQTSFLNSKSAGGCKKWIETVSHKTVEDIYETLRHKGFQILATDFSDDAVNFRDIDYTLPTAVVVGTELEGLSSNAVEKADRRIIIPMMGMSQSLNVSVATALILFEAQRQREEKGLYDITPLMDESDFRISLEWAYPSVAKNYKNNHLPVPEIDGEGNILD